MLDEIANILEQNQAKLRSFRSELRSAIRREAIQAALLYCQEILGESLSPPSEEALILATGHQPTLPHFGVLRKYEVLGSAGKELNIVPINIIIDTDTGELGEVVFPLQQGEEKQISKRDILNQGEERPFCFSIDATGAAVLPNLKLIEREVKAAGVELDLTSLFRWVEGELDTPKASVPFFTEFRRRYFSKERCLELPLSTISTLPAVQSFFSELLVDGERLFHSINDTLDEYRRSRKIKNKANPFPNLQTGEWGRELPFWWFDRSERSREQIYFKRLSEHCFRIRTESGSLDLEYGSDTLQAVLIDLNQRGFIAPKAVLVTTLLRCFLSDGFIHGTGGARYDNYTDEFIKKYWGITPPEFVTETETRYLFPSQAHKLLEYQGIQEKMREMIFHPEKFFALSFFGEQARSEITALQERKRVLISEIRLGREQKVSVAKETQEIKKIEREIGKVIDEGLLRYFGEITQWSEKHREAVLCRGYSVCCFGGSLREVVRLSDGGDGIG